MTNKSYAVINRGTTAITHTFTFQKRANEGLGSFETAANTLAIMTLSRDDVIRGVDLVDAVIGYLLSNDVDAYCQPANMTAESAIRMALDSIPFRAVTATHTLLFDGQFGSVYVGSA